MIKYVFVFLYNSTIVFIYASVCLYIYIYIYTHIYFSYCLIHILSDFKKKTSFSIYCKLCLLEMDFFFSFFCLFQKGVYYAFILKHIFARYDTLVFWFIFPALLSHCILVFIVSDEKSALQLIGVPLYISPFSLVTFKIFCLSLALYVFNMMCLHFE